MREAAARCSRDLACPGEIAWKAAVFGRECGALRRSAQWIPNSLLFAAKPRFEIPLVPRRRLRCLAASALSRGQPHDQTIQVFRDLDLAAQAARGLPLAPSDFYHRPSSLLRCPSPP